jgi:hypothetical protein
MNMKDLYDKIAPRTMIESALLAADTTPSAIDLQGFKSAAIVLDIGVGGITFDGTNKIEFVLTHSDDDSTYTNVADADVLGVTGVTNGIIKSLVAAHAAATISKFGYIGGKRYIKLKADFSGTHGTGTQIAAIAILADAAFQPAA